MVMVNDECWYIVVVHGGVSASAHLHRWAATTSPPERVHLHS